MAINKLILPDSVNTIKDYAFKNSTNLARVDIGGGGTNVLTSLDSIITVLRNKGFNLSDTAFNGISKIHPSHGFSYTITKAATCTDTGSKTGSCKCGSKDTQSIAATGHGYGDWVVTKAATCGAAGSKKKTCSNCGNIITETIAATGQHTYGSWIISSDKKTKSRTCSNCGNKETVSNTVDLKDASVNVKAKYNFLGVADTVKLYARSLSGSDGTGVPYGVFTYLNATLEKYRAYYIATDHPIFEKCILYLPSSVTIDISKFSTDKSTITYKAGYYQLNELEFGWWQSDAGTGNTTCNYLDIWEATRNEISNTLTESKSIRQVYTYLGSTYSVVNDR